MEGELQEGGGAAGRLTRWQRWRLRAPRWPLLLPAVAVALAYCWVYRTPAVAMVGMAYHFDVCVASLLVALLAAGRCVQLAMRKACAARLGARADPLPPRRWFWPWLLLIAAATVLLLRFRVPMRACFALSRPALDRAADQALADPANAGRLSGRWAGLYRLAGAEVVGSTVVLYLHRGGGMYGFARVPGAAADLIHRRPGAEDAPGHHPALPQDANSAERVGQRIADDWFVMYSWYWLVKVGWS